MNFLRRNYLKYTDSKAYNIYKENKRQESLLNRIRQAHTEAFDLPRKTEYSFKHCGNCGDIIYSMPAMLSLAGWPERTAISLYLQTDRKVAYGKTISHPLGEVSLNDRMVQMIKPLLLSQNVSQSARRFTDSRSTTIWTRSANTPFYTTAAAFVDGTSWSSRGITT